MFLMLFSLLPVFAATKVSISNGSNIYCQSVRNFPSVVPGYGSCGLMGQINLSKTHKESKPAFSAPFARLMIFSFVAWLEVQQLHLQVMERLNHLSDPFPSIYYVIK
jgi:hypothetical protein